MWSAAIALSVMAGCAFTASAEEKAAKKGDADMGAKCVTTTNYIKVTSPSFSAYGRRLAIPGSDFRIKTAKESCMIVTFTSTVSACGLVKVIALVNNNPAFPREAELIADYSCSGNSSSNTVSFVFPSVPKGTNVIALEVDFDSRYDYADFAGRTVIVQY